MKRSRKAHRQLDSQRSNYEVFVKTSDARWTNQWVNVTETVPRERENKLFEVDGVLSHLSNLMLMLPTGIGPMDTVNNENKPLLKWNIIDL
jgi:hypothetical protein